MNMLNGDFIVFPPDKAPIELDMNESNPWNGIWPIPTGSYFWSKDHWYIWCVPGTGWNPVLEKYVPENVKLQKLLLKGSL